MASPEIAELYEKLIADEFSFLSRGQHQLSASHEISVATYDSTVYLNYHLSCRKLRQLFHPGP